MERSSIITALYFHCRNSICMCSEKRLEKKAFSQYGADMIYLFFHILSGIVIFMLILL